MLRSGDGLGAAVAILDDAWGEARRTLHADGVDAYRARQAAAMVAHARWMYRAALSRTESRGMHKRLDHPGTDPGQHRRQLVGGLDEVWVRS